MCIRDSNQAAQITQNIAQRTYIKESIKQSYKKNALNRKALLHYKTRTQAHIQYIQKTNYNWHTNTQLLVLCSSSEPMCSSYYLPICVSFIKSCVSLFVFIIFILLFVLWLVLCTYNESQIPLNRNPFLLLPDDRKCCKNNTWYKKESNKFLGLSQLATGVMYPCHASVVNIQYFYTCLLYTSRCV